MSEQILFSGSFFVWPFWLLLGGLLGRALSDAYQVLFVGRPECYERLGLWRGCSIEQAKAARMRRDRLDWRQGGNLGKITEERCKTTKALRQVVLDIRMQNGWH